MDRMRETVGCLFIGDIASDGSGQEGGAWARDVPGVDVRVFHCVQPRGLWSALQGALYEVRRERGEAAIMAVGTGCAGALALACQLPVEKLVLIEPSLPGRASKTGPDCALARQTRRMARRLAAYARRNLPLCVSDILTVECRRDDDGGIPRRLFGNPVNCRVSRLLLRGGSAKELYTIREFEVKEAISRFLHPVEAPKPLAEKSEMCIIYG